MNAETLHAVDTIYLLAFRQNLVDDLLRARVSLKQCMRQSLSLAMAQELPTTFRRSYQEIAERLPTLISAVRSMLEEIERNCPPSFRSVLKPVDSEITDLAEAVGAIAMLDAVEHQILDVLNDVGKSLAVLQSPIVSWDECARLKICMTLQKLAERPCYHTVPPVELRIHPFLIVECAATPNPKLSRWPHYLVDDIVPTELLPWVDGIRIEVEIRGEGDGFSIFNPNPDAVLPVF